MPRAEAAAALLAVSCPACPVSDPHPGNLLASTDGSLVYLDFGMMSEAPEYARYAIMAHVVHLVNRWEAAGASCGDQQHPEGCQCACGCAVGCKVECSWLGEKQQKSHGLWTACGLGRDRAGCVWLCACKRERERANDAHRGRVGVQQCVVRGGGGCPCDGVTQQETSTTGCMAAVAGRRGIFSC